MTAVIEPAHAPIVLREVGPPMIETDETLIARTLRGELNAFEMLVEHHRDVVFRVAARIVGPDDAADVSQDAFLRAFHRLDRFKGAAPFLDFRGFRGVVLAA